MSFVSFNFRIVLIPDDANPSKYIDPGPIAPAITKWIKDYVDHSDIDEAVTGFIVKYDAPTGRFKSSFVFRSLNASDPRPTVDEITGFMKMADTKFNLDGRPYAVHCKDLVYE
jgi:FPC/CPF motif-containing protein YcgG